MTTDGEPTERGHLVYKMGEVTDDLDLVEYGVLQTEAGVWRAYIKALGQMSAVGDFATEAAALVEACHLGDELRAVGLLEPIATGDLS